MGQLQLRIVLDINAIFACLAVYVMSVEVFTKNELSPSLGILAITYLVVSCYLALGTDWARIVSAEFSAVVVIASLTILFAIGGLDIMTFVALAFGLIFSLLLIFYTCPSPCKLN